MIKKISINDIFDYISCPLKIKLSNIDVNNKVTSIELYKLAAKAAIVSFFSSMAIGKSYKASCSDSMEKFMHVWTTNLDKLVEAADDKKYFHKNNLLMSRINTIYNVKHDQIVAVNYPLTISIKDDVILEDNIDLIIIRERNSILDIKTYSAISFSPDHEILNDRLIEMRTSFFKLALQRHLGRNSSRNFLFEYRPLSGIDKIYTPGVGNYNSIISYTLNIIKAMENNIFYPTSLKTVCESCKYNKQCSLSIIKNKK